MAATATSFPAERFDEVTSCALCGSAEQRLRFEEPPFRVVACAACGLVYVTPRLRAETLPEVYGSDYWRSESPKDRGYADYRSDEALYLATFRKRLRLVERFARPPGRALDVGCAAGFFLVVLREAGWDADGVELSPVIAAHARERYGFDRIHVGELETAPFAEGTYDLVTMWDVVEHVPDPVALLRRAAAMLAPGGHLVLETQNVESPFARLMGPRWQHYKHLEHLYHFGPDTLDRLLDAAGLTRVHRTARYGGKHVSVGFIRERAQLVHPVVSTLLRPFAPLDRKSAYVNVFDEMVVVACRAESAG